jgi:hypothetical protein
MNYRDYSVSLKDKVSTNLQYYKSILQKTKDTI